jgi:hypothetical protein
MPASNGTYVIKHELRACGYRWDAVKKIWKKSFPVKNFSPEVIRREAWTATATNVEVLILDEAERTLIYHYNVINEADWIPVQPPPEP